MLSKRVHSTVKARQVLFLRIGSIVGVGGDDAILVIAGTVSHFGARVSGLECAEMGKRGARRDSGSTG